MITSDQKQFACGKILLPTEFKEIASMSVEANAEFCPSVWKLLPFFLSAVESCHCLPGPLTRGERKELALKSVTKEIRISSSRV